MTARAATLRVLSFNAHVGLGILSGGLAWALTRHGRVHVLCVQEGRALAALRRLLGRRWHIIPLRQPGKGVSGQAMTYVCLRRSRFPEVREHVNRRLSRHPYPRRLTGAVALDRVTGRWVVVSSLHPDPLGAGFEHANPRARAKHVNQVRAYAGWHASHAELDPVQLCVGDSNETLTPRAHAGLPPELRRRSARALLGAVGMTPASDDVRDPGPVHLDDAFTGGRGVTVKRRRSFRVPFRGMDHLATVVTVRVAA